MKSWGRLLVLIFQGPVYEIMAGLVCLLEAGRAEVGSAGRCEAKVCRVFDGV